MKSRDVGVTISKAENGWVVKEDYTGNLHVSESLTEVLYIARTCLVAQEVLKVQEVL